MKERRSTPRHRCRLRCSVKHGRKQVDGFVVDVSLSGLSVQAPLVLSQGDLVWVEIHEPLRVEIKALAWNIRRMRKADQVTSVIGMMLSEAGREYEMIVARIGGADTKPAAAPVRAATAPARPRVGADVAKLLTPARLPWWKLRVREKGGSRSRVITLPAASAEEAAAKSLAEIGAGWEVVDVRQNV